jgi:hypothetical protein
MPVNVLDLLDSGQYQTYNRKVARELGSVNAAIILSDLVNRYNYHNDNNELRSVGGGEPEWFYYTVDKCEERTVLSRKEQETAIKILESNGLFDKKNVGVPPKRHFRLNIEKIVEFTTGIKELFKTPERGALKRPKGALQDDRKGRYTKEPHKEPEYKNNNNDPNPPDPEPVVVFSCLKDLGIDEPLKVKLCKQFTEEQLVSAVRGYWLSRVHISNAYGWIVACISRGGFVQEPTEEDRGLANRKWSEKNLQDLYLTPEGAGPNSFRCTQYGKHIEVLSEPFTEQGDFIDYEVVDFKQQLQKSFEKRGIHLNIE